MSDEEKDSGREELEDAAEDEPTLPEDVVASGDDEDEDEEKDEAEPSDGESVDSSDEEEEDGGNEYEDDGFVVDGDDGEGEDGEGEGEEGVQKKRKKGKKRKSLRLDEDDYDLLEENQVKVRFLRKLGQEFSCHINHMVVDSAHAPHVAKQGGRAQIGDCRAGAPRQCKLAMPCILIHSGFCCLWITRTCTVCLPFAPGMHMCSCMHGMFGGWDARMLTCIFVCRCMHAAIVHPACAAPRVKRPTGHKRLKRAGEGKRAADAEEMRAELFGDAGDQGGQVERSGADMPHLCVLAASPEPGCRMRRLLRDASMRIHTCTCICTPAHACMHACPCMHKQLQPMHAHACMHACMHTNTFAHVHIRTGAHLQARMYACFVAR
eukprot:289255-Chlamydomonas_euryale.AAC.11